jgi:NAD(P)-dependent dehydrogenase (short-subunit alcohol dehydrogenase family)
VGFTYRDGKGPANELEQEITDSGGQAVGFQADSEDPEAVRTAISETDRAPIGGISVYSLTKAAVAGLSRNLARELGPRGITVNTVQPGPVATDMNPDSGEFADAVRSATAVGHYAQPDDIANAVAFLARPEAGFVTGTAWNVDGGYAL